MQAMFASISFLGCHYQGYQIQFVSICIKCIDIFKLLIDAPSRVHSYGYDRQSSYTVLRHFQAQLNGNVIGQVINLDYLNN